MLKGLSLIERILTSGGIEHQQSLVRGTRQFPRYYPMDFFEFFHQGRLGMQAAGCVDNDHVDCAGNSSAHAVKGDCGGRGATLVLDQFYPEPSGPHLQLLTSRRAESVGRYQQHFALLSQKPSGQSSNRRIC